MNLSNSPRSGIDRDRVPVETGKNAYLRPEVKIEPLVYRWCAWPYLIAPATHAMNLAFRHLPKLKSFLANPALHIAATQDPEMLGGSHLTLTPDQVSRAREFAMDISQRCAKHVEFARAFHELNDKVHNNAKGHALDDYYKNLPEIVAGKLELVYDLNHRPKIKVLEELLYESEINTQKGQEICLHCLPDNGRPFFMSAPVLGSDRQIILGLNFADARIDELASMRANPASIECMSEKLQISAAQSEVFTSFFTSEAPRRVQPNYTGAGVRVRYFGHACVLLETANVAVLLDPLTAWERDTAAARFTFDDLPDFIDYVIITHSHQDHFVTETLLQLRRRIGKILVPANARGNLADPSLLLILKHMGFSNTQAIQPFDRLEIADGDIMSIPFIGEHGGLDVDSKHCAVIRLQGRGFVFLVDSAGVEVALYRLLASRIGKVEALFIGMECHGAPMSWLYGPLMSRPISRRDDESRRLSAANYECAWGILRELRCAQAFVYAMGQEPWLTWLMGRAYSQDSVQLRESDRFIERCRRADIPAERLFGCRELMF